MGVRSMAGTLNCLECGHKWKSDFQETIKCPSCLKKLKIMQTQKRTLSFEDNFTVVSTIEEFQLIRTFFISVNLKSGILPKYSITETNRIFIDSKGNHEVISKIHSNSFYGYWHGPLILRSRDSFFRNYDEGHIYPKWKLHDFSVQKGFCSDLNHHSTGMVFMTMIGILKYPALETLAKARRYDFFNHFLFKKDAISFYWPTIKVCMRQDYSISNLNMYMDMLACLIYFKKDLLSPKYVCPENFDQAYVFWRKKKEKRARSIWLANEKKRKIKLANSFRIECEKYDWKMSFYKSFCINVDGLLIRPLLKIKEVKEAGEVLRHCIYETTSYWKGNDNILFGAFLEDKLIETSQFSINQRKTVQSYGKENKETEYHRTIIKEIDSRSKEILSLFRKQSKKSMPKKEIAQ
jgi:hypothetical protein